MEIPKKGIVVDASCVGGNPGIVECRGLDLETGELVFDEKIGMATNNLGEIFAIAYGASYIKEQGTGLRLYSDSKIAINWYLNKEIKTNIFRDYPHLANQNPLLASLIIEANEIIDSCRVNIQFWDKKGYGIENPADYGRK